jgi:hypothetical protein
MGDWADAVLEGEFCEGCGTEMEIGVGYPQRCKACSEAGDTDDSLLDDGAEKAELLMREIRMFDALELDRFLSELRAWLTRSIIIHSEEGQPIAIESTIDPTPYYPPR